MSKLLVVLALGIGAWVGVAASDEPPAPDRLAQIEARLAAIEGRVAALEGRRDEAPRPATSATPTALSTAQRGALIALGSALDLQATGSTNEPDPERLLTSDHQAALREVESLLASGQFGGWPRHQRWGSFRQTIGNAGILIRTLVLEGALNRPAQRDALFQWELAIARPLKEGRLSDARTAAIRFLDAHAARR